MQTQGELSAPLETMHDILILTCSRVREPNSESKVSNKPQGGMWCYTLESDCSLHRQHLATWSFAGQDSRELQQEMKHIGSWLQVAQFSAELGQYGEAIGIYEDVAKRCVDNNLLKYSAKGYLLNAGICHLCGELPLLASLTYSRLPMGT